MKYEQGFEYAITAKPGLLAFGQVEDGGSLENDLALRGNVKGANLVEQGGLS